MPERIANFQADKTKLTHRICRVEVEVSQKKEGENIIHNTLIFDGLNVNFNITKTRGSVSNKGHISICNLNKEQIEYLTTITAWNTPQEQRKVIRLYAGYKDNDNENVGLIFQGDIVQAFPTTEPDVWLECECITGFQKQLENTTMAFNGIVDANIIGQSLSKKLDVSYNWKAKENKQIDSFYYAGSITKAIAELNNIGGFVAYMEDEQLIVDNAIPSTPKEGEVRIYNELSGLISHPEPNFNGVKIRVLLDPSIKCGEAIKLESEMIPSANGVYWIYSVRHFGELRGQAFYTELDCKAYR